MTKETWTCYRDNRGCDYATNREPIDALDTPCPRCSHTMQQHGTRGCYVIVMGFEGAHECQCGVSA